MISKPEKWKKNDNNFFALFLEATAPKHEILYKNPSKLKLADFEKIPPTQSVTYSSLGQDSADSESETEDQLPGNPLTPAVVPIHPFLYIAMGRSESSSTGFEGQSYNDRPFSFFRSHAIDNNAEGNENTYICNSNFRNPKKTDAGPFNDSLLSGGQLMAPEIQFESKFPIFASYERFPDTTETNWIHALRENTKNSWIKFGKLGKRRNISSAAIFY